MLKNYSKLVNKVQEKFQSIDHWNDVKFSEGDKEKIKLIDQVTYVNDYSVQLAIDGGNHIIIPSQYILYAIAIKELANNVYDYLRVFEELKHVESMSSIAKKIREESLNYSELNIDEFSKSIGPRIFYDAELNLGAKDIVNGPENKLVLRGTTDFFGSIILKPINIPNASSSILGKFIYNLCRQPEVYEYLENRFIEDVSYIVKDKIIKDFCYQVICFLYNYDKLERLEGRIDKNTDTKFGSIKNEGNSLTSIFRISKAPLEHSDLIQGGKARFFEDPLFILNNEYYYLSTEWTNDGKGRLDLSSFKEIIESVYSEFRIDYKDSTYYLLSSKVLTQQHNKTITGLIHGYNKIYFGAPGTGKSYKVTQLLEKYNVPENRFERVTFHPDYDYSSFVGGYKPVSQVNENDKLEVNYQFVPQVFTNIYVDAHQNPDENFYLVIEEINRGNCAEIFGDIFQLLDRNPNYMITPSEDLRNHLIALDKDSIHKTLRNGKMFLPNNLILLATMNTSDQSLYPMDSAFKRRWNWEYVPIHYPENAQDKSCPSYGFRIRIDSETFLNWIEFVREINKHIVRNPSLGMDKCLGNFFIKPEAGDTITLDNVINKVIFYLWNDVFKDEDNEIFQEQTYLDYFPIETSGVKRLMQLVEKLGLQNSLETIYDTTIIESADDSFPIESTEESI